MTLEACGMVALADRHNVVDNDDIVLQPRSMTVRTNKYRILVKTRIQLEVTTRTRSSPLLNSLSRLRINSVLPGRGMQYRHDPLLQKGSRVQNVVHIL